MKTLLWITFLVLDCSLFGLMFFYLQLTPNEFEVFMMSAAPAVFLLALLLALGACWHLRWEIISLYRKLRPAWCYIVTVLVIGLVALFAISKNHYHLIWYDEDIYEAQACSTASTFQSRICGYGLRVGSELHCLDGPYNKEPVGYPTTLAIFYRLFGCTEHYNFIFQALLYLVLLVLVLGIALLLFDSTAVAIYSAAASLLSYPLLLWWQTMAIEPTAVVFSCFACFGMLFSYRHYQNSKASLLALSTLTLASMTRPEGSLIWLLFLGGGLLFVEDTKQFLRKLLIAAPVIGLLMMIQLIHFIKFSHFTWGNDAGGAKFFANVIATNLTTNLNFFFDNSNISLILATLAVLGALPFSRLLFFNLGYLRERFFLFLWFLLFFAIFLPFYAGSYQYGMDSRFALLCLIPLAMLAAVTCRRLPQPLGFAIIVLFSCCYFPRLSQPVERIWSPYADHHYGEMLLKQVERDALVVTPNPQMTMMIGVNTLYDGQLDSFINERPDELKRFAKIYFYFSFWCNVAPRENQERSYCYKSIESHNGQLIQEYQERDHRYALYLLNVN